MISLGAALEDRFVIVTGAASGIGRATSLLCADAGARVFAVDRDADGLKSLAAELPGDPRRHRTKTLDLADTELLEPMVREVAALPGGLRALIHVAARLVREPVEDVSIASWDGHVDVNLKATFFLNRAVGAVLTQAGQGGRIVNFTSGSWLTGPAFGSDVYVATKAGVVALTRGFARKFGPAGISVNVVSPGQIDTPMQHRDNDPAVVAAGVAHCPMGRMGRPEEVARVALFLASDSASFMSGATVTVSGARSMY